MISSTVGQTAQLAIRQSDRILAALVIIAMVGTAVSSAQLGFGSIQQPGPGLWPMAVSIFTIVVALVSMGVRRETPDTITRDGALRTLLFIVFISAIIPIYTFAGFIIAGTVSTLLILKGVFRQGWIKSCIVAVLGTVAVYVLFAIALNVPLQDFGG